MTRDDLINQTEPFQPDIPYSFISYAHHEKDQQIVWRDLAVLDQTFNVWQDTKDIDFTKNWKHDTSEVITHENCLMLIFYVSKNSLRTSNCLRELLLLETHPDLKLILVEAEPDIRGSLIPFIDTLLEETMNARDLESAVRLEQLETIINFKNFFKNTGRLDQSRIPYAENASPSYYTALTRSIPEETKKPLKPQPASTSADQTNQVITYPNGDCYTGEVKIVDQQGKAVPHGIGRMLYFDGFEYSGQWKDGQKDGIGKLLYPEENPRQIVCYSGEWCRDKKHGIGLEVYTDVRKTASYLGEWNQDKKNGQGFSTYRDGSAKWHEWKNGDRTDRTGKE